MNVFELLFVYVSQSSDYVVFMQICQEKKKKSALDVIQSHGSQPVGDYFPNSSNRSVQFFHITAIFQHFDFLLFMKRTALCTFYPFIVAVNGVERSQNKFAPVIALPEVGSASN